MHSRLSRGGLLLIAWLPFLLFWLFLAMTLGRESPGMAAARAVLTIGSAALLAIPVSRFCSVRPWPGELRASFYIRHFGSATLYALAWIAASTATDSLLSGRNFWRTIRSNPAIAWQFVMGLWLYGVIAGISYAIGMQRTTHESEIRALQAEAGLAAARLQALRSRLQPHFLFNALHTIAALSRQDAERTESAIEKLGYLLRYTLDDGRGDIVPFGEEWDFTRGYLDFEKLRYEERLTVDTDIDPASLSCGTPSFALQTLVENAVRHSIARRAGGGRVEIAARCDGDRLQLRVFNDGEGSGEPGLQYGLRTLRERLEAVYGSEARLIAGSGPSGFEVTLSIPCSKVAGEDHDD